MPQVISIKTFYTSKRTSFFTFFKRTLGLHKKNLSNQLSNSSTNFALGIKQRNKIVTDNRKRKIGTIIFCLT